MMRLFYAARAFLRLLFSSNPIQGQVWNVDGLGLVLITSCLDKVSYRATDGRHMEAWGSDFRASADLVRHPTSAQLGALGFLMSGEEE